MVVFKKKSDLIAYLSSNFDSNSSIGFVPTMGALHQGHLSLIQKALDDNELAVVSIFVNPTQFDNPNDLVAYPRTLETDVELLKTLSNDIVVYSPNAEDIYGDEVVASNFSFGGLENEMEGQFRTGHFDGVGTIVKRLFEIVRPTNAYFGEKDFQQLAIIRHMVKQHGLPVTIVGCPIFREDDGLAMSSRNVRLTENQRDTAPFIYKTLLTAKTKFGTESVTKINEWVNTKFSKVEALNLEYFVIADENTLKPIEEKKEQSKYRAFIAVYAGDIRLIDNIALN
ncbi:MAG: pantoate--beta-alanine ligase [Bacteroidetes bacterium MedPE-SWsnd-G2]|nr:MAG: pantoate--beta-alanine ligase [Bacteroidetes bacterium MedPE-SWsnd-G2]